MAPRKGHVFKSLEQRLMEKVHFEPNSGCWLWAGADNASGYGKLAIGHSARVYAHRASYELAKGPIPDGMHLDHLCRVTCCINPDHLEPVTNRENARRGQAGDHMKRAAPAGERHPRAKLTDAQASQIKSRAANGEPHKSIAEDFGVCLATVSHIKTGRRISW